MQALSELYDRVPTFPRPIAMKIIEDELGCSVEHAFSYVSDETVAAASFGQVRKPSVCSGHFDTNLEETFLSIFINLCLIFS